MYSQTFKHEPYPFEEFWSFIVERGHLLELGASGDQILSQALERNLEVTSFNINQITHLAKFGDDYFDGAVLYNLLSSLPSAQHLNMLDEIGRVLKPFSFVHISEVEDGIKVHELIELVEESGFKIMRLNYDPFKEKPGFSLVGQKD